MRPNCSKGSVLPLRHRFRWLTALASDRRGVTSLIFGVATLAILGTVGLATEGGLWYADYAQLQTTADAASTSGAVGIAAGDSTTKVIATANYILSQNGYVNGANGVTTTVNVPPLSGPNKGNGNAVEVILTQPETLRISGLFLTTAPTLKVRSVALYGSSSSTCVLAIGRDIGGANNGGLNLSGGATLNANGCSVASNNTGSNAVDISPSPNITAYSLLSSGGINFNCYMGPPGCGTTLNETKPYSQYHVATTDPLAATQNVPLPSNSNFTPSSCTPVSFPQWNSAVTESPGTYCGASINDPQSLTLNAGGSGCTTACSFTFNGGINIGSSGSLSIDAAGSGYNFYINGNFSVSGSATADIAPGTYFIYNGNLTVGNSGTLTCSACVAGGAGVTFVMMPGSTAGTGIVDISGSSPVTFNAPATNSYNPGLNGIAIYEPVTDTGTNQLQGSGSLTLTGAIYTPGALLDISGAAGASSATCSVLIANTVTITGSGNASSKDCSAYGFSAASGTTPNGVTIVE